MKVLNSHLIMYSHTQNTDKTVLLCCLSLVVSRHHESVRY